MAENKQLLNKFRGTGAGSRVSVYIFKLEDHSSSYSSSQVQQHLKRLGTFDKFKGETYFTIFAPEPHARI